MDDDRPDRHTAGAHAVGRADAALGMQHRSIVGTDRQRLAEDFPFARGGDRPLLLELAITLAKVGAFAGLAILIGPKVVPWVLGHVARTGSRELFTLSVLAVALGIAYGSAQIFGVSFALGAFFAGVVLSESSFSHKAAEDSLPLQDAFSVLFFVSVGMLFDPAILVRQPDKVLAVLALIVFGKSLIAFAIIMLLRYPIGTGLMVSASVASSFSVLRIWSK